MDAAAPVPFQGCPDSPLRAGDQRKDECSLNLGQHASAQHHVTTAFLPPFTRPQITSPNPNHQLVEINSLNESEKTPRGTWSQRKGQGSREPAVVMPRASGRGSPGPQPPSEAGHQHGAISWLGQGCACPRTQPVQQLISQAGSFAVFLSEERDTNTSRLNPPCLIRPFRSLSLKPSGTLTTLNIDHRMVVVSSSLWSMHWGRSTLVYVLVFSISIFYKQAKALFFNRFIWIIGISEIYIHSFSPSLLEVLKQPQWISSEPKCQDVKLQAPLTLKGCFSSSPRVGHVFAFF